jgi:hypothetical protein
MGRPNPREPHRSSSLLPACNHALALVERGVSWPADLVVLRSAAAKAAPRRRWRSKCIANLIAATRSSRPEAMRWHSSSAVFPGRRTR